MELYRTASLAGRELPMFASKNSDAEAGGGIASGV
jgi:hypothetical protein